MRLTSLALAAAASAALATPSTAQQDSDDWLERCRRNPRNGDRMQHCEVRESRISARETLRVDAGQNGGVIVRAWDGRDVLVRARVHANADTEDAARELARGIRIDTDGTIHAEGPESRYRRSWAVTFEVLVPARTNLELRAHNGPLSVQGVTGEMDLNTVNGPLSLRDLGGDVTARTQNGPLSVTLSGTRWSGGELDAETTNGPVTLQIPRGYHAHLETGTVNGPLALDIDIDTPPGRRSRRISTDLNGGGPTIRAITTNGPVVVREN